METTTQKSGPVTVPSVNSGAAAGKRSVSAKPGANRRQSAPKPAVMPAAPKQHPASMSHVQVKHGHKCEARDIGHAACLAKGCKVCAHLAG